MMELKDVMPGQRVRLNYRLHEQKRFPQLRLETIEHWMGTAPHPDELWRVDRLEGDKVLVVHMTNEQTLWFALADPAELTLVLPAVKNPFEWHVLLDADLEKIRRDVYAQVLEAFAGAVDNVRKSQR